MNSPVLLPEMRAALVQLHLHVASRGSADGATVILGRIKQLVMYGTKYMYDEDGEVGPAGVLGRELILAAMTYYGRSRTIQSHGCSILALTRWSTPETTTNMQFWESRMVDAVLNAMGHNKDNAIIQADGMQILNELGRYDLGGLKLYTDNIASAGGINIILSAIQRHQECPTLQGHGYWILRNLTIADADHRVDIMSKRGIRIILNAMGHHREDVKVLIRGCYALQQLSLSGLFGETSDKNAFETAKGGVDTILAAMRLYPTDEVVQKCCCRALAHLVNRGNSRTMVAAQRGIHLVVTAMESAAVSQSEIIEPVVQRHALFFLRDYVGLRASRKNVERIIAAGGVDAILATMRRHESHLHVQWVGFESLINIAFQSIGRVSIAAKGGIGTTVATMKRFKSNTGIQILGCQVLDSLATRSYDNRIKIPSEGGIVTILDAMRTFPMSFEMQRCGGQALIRLDLSRYDTSIQVVSAGGLTVLVNFVKNHRTNNHWFDIVTLLSALLRFVGRSEVTIEQLESAGTVDVVRVVLTAHPRSVLVQWLGKRILKAIAARKSKGQLLLCESE